MTRIKLKNGGKGRRKALFGEAAVAAATMAAAGINAAATREAAKAQADAATSAANIQADSIKQQTSNNNALQRESIDFTRQQNQENRQQQQDIQTTLQMLAGQQNMNDRLEANKLQVKYGGSAKRASIKSSPFYGGGGLPFKVTDGGAAIPISITPEGYGLYELAGNDHEHYHKAPGGKRKTGVGIKFQNGSVVEGEGNQNTNQGELLYVTPEDAVFISKHSIAGYNPAKAVQAGEHPLEAYTTQEILKSYLGINSDGSRRRKSLGGLTVLNPIVNTTQLPNSSGAVGGAIYLTSPTRRTTSPVARYGGRIRLKSGGTSAWGNYWNTYGGATLNSAGNLLGAGINTFGNLYAANKLGNAYTQAGNILADAYSQMHGIDMSEIKREDYEAPHTLAVVRSANTNINPQLERIRRNAAYESGEINRGTMSSAARQQRLAAVNDRMLQRAGEQYANKNNLDEQIKQTNAERITATAEANANRDVQARRDYGTQRMSLLQYNNNIENAKIAGAAQARADAITQAQMANSSALQTSMNAIGSALAASGQAFGTAYDTARKYRAEEAYNLLGMNDVQQVNYVINTNNYDGAKQLWNNKLALLNDTSRTLTPEARLGLISDLNNLKVKFPQLVGVVPVK